MKTSTGWRATTSGRADDGGDGAGGRPHRAIALIALTHLFSAIRLVTGIFTDTGFGQNAIQLLTIGAVVWVTNVIAFGLLFWDVDGGGSWPRAVRGAWSSPAIVFPEMTIPEVVGELVLAQAINSL